MSSACLKFAAEYVSQHLHGLTVLSALPESTSAALAPLIVTHNGSFHGDEAMACGLLRHTAAYAQARVLRTRDPALIAQGTIVVDVGAEYDSARLRFDHHQASFHETMQTPRKQYHTRLSSAGLIYRHFGRDLIADFVHTALASPQRATLLQLTGWPSDRNAMPAHELDTVYDAVYANLVEEVDGVDNGVANMGLDPNMAKCDAALVHHYVQNTTLAARVSRLQTWWNDPVAADAAVVENAGFVRAVELSSVEFFEAVSYYAFSWLPARSLVERAFCDATAVHESGKIVVLRERFCPWKEHLMQLEQEHDRVGHVLYVIYSDGKGWRVQAVPKSATSGFENRKPLPYRGLRDEALSEASGIAGGVFVHVSGFIGGMRTYDGALQLAIQALSAE